MKKIENRLCSYINLDFLQFLVVSHYTTYTFYRYTYLISNLLNQKIRIFCFKKISKVVFIPI